VGVALLVILLAWVLGAVGYQWFEQLAWVDAFLCAAMNLA
jgi:hypothetical protein